MAADASSAIRLRVIYTGRVQGVGFRWTTSNIARGYEVAGTVANLTDGTVELVAQGTRPAVEAFLAEVAFAMRENIAETQTEELTVQDDLTGFRILR